MDEGWKMCCSFGKETWIWNHRMSSRMNIPEISFLRNVGLKGLLTEKKMICCWGREVIKTMVRKVKEVVLKRDQLVEKIWFWSLRVLSPFWALTRHSEDNSTQNSSPWLGWTKSEGKLSMSLSMGLGIQMHGLCSRNQQYSKYQHWGKYL